MKSLEKNIKDDSITDTAKSDMLSDYLIIKELVEHYCKGFGLSENELSGKLV